MKALRNFLFTLSFVYCCLTVMTAQEVPEIVQFKNEHPWINHQNWMITQDCEGYIYVANSNGVFIYNGFDWQKILLPQQQKPRAVFRGKDCRIYAGGYEAFGYIDRSDPSRPYYQPVADSILLGTQQEIWNIFGNDQQIVIQSFSNLFIFDYQVITSVIPPSNIMLGKNIEEKLFIPKIEQGLYELQGQTINAIHAVDDLPPKVKIADLSVGSSSGEIVLGTQYNGLYRFLNNDIVSVNSALNDRLKAEQINKIIRLRSGSYAIGTILNGVYITDDFLSVKYHLNKTTGLSNNTVLSLFEDRQQNLWIGLDKGVDLLRINNPVNYYYDQQGKLGNIFTTIHHQGVLYLGTNQGVFRQQPDGSFQLIDNSQGQIWSFLIVDGDLICGHNKGTFLVKENEFIQISDITGGWYMEKTGKGSVLQSTYTGLVKLEKKGKKWMPPRRIEEGNLMLEKFILIDTLLVGYHAYHGIHKLIFESRNYDKIVKQKKILTSETLAEHVKINLLEASDAIVMMADTNLLVLNENEFNEIDHLLRQQLFKDEKFKLNFDFFQTIQDVASQKSFLNAQFYQPEMAQDDFIVGFDEGYLKIPRQSVNYQKNSGVTELDYLLVNGKLKRNTTNSEYKFSAREQNITIQLKNISYGIDFNNLQYQLLNWDNRWYPVADNGRINFVNLDDGNYTLKIKYNSEVPEKLLAFDIAPRWYESWIGALLYTILFIRLIYYLNRRNEQKLSAKTEQLKAEKKKELESAHIKSKNDQLQREIIYKSKMLANSTLSLVQKNKMLNQLKQEISKDSTGDSSTKQRILRLINRNINRDEDWEIFERNFAAVHEDFLEKLKSRYPSITAGELRLAAYIRMNLSSKEIAPLLNISVRAVENKRYRLRKKMELEHEDNLSEHLLRL